ncbi:MAG: hypothetical protein ACOYVF_03975 [Candidatus Zixiibacteriota bacterium]
MNEKLRKKIIFACLALAIIWGFNNIDFGREKLPEEPTRTSGPEIQNQPQAESVSRQAFEERELQDWGQDPFRTKITARRAKPSGQWVVSGILYNKTSPLAYINAQPVKVGDTVDNARVVTIDKDFVTLEYEGNKQKIYVLEG